MLFEQLNPASCKTYLIASSETKEAMVVDPVLEHVEEYMKTLKDKGLKLRYVIDTHTHADHITGGTALRDRLDAQYCMSSRAPAACANLRVDEGDELEVGEVSLGFLYTPGHTQDHLTIVMKDRLFTGDFLFIGEAGAGRTDLPGGDPGVHYDSLQRLKAFDDSLLIFPAHDYRGKTTSTLGKERKENPRLRPISRETYVEWLESLRAPTPEWMKDVLRANYACALDPRAAWTPVDLPACEVQNPCLQQSVNVHDVQSISPRELKSLLDSSQTRPLILDVRQPEEYEGELGHITGSILIPLGEIPLNFASIKEQNPQGIVTVCRMGNRSMTAASILSKAGFHDVQSLQGGMTLWRELGYPSERERAAN